MGDTPSNTFGTYKKDNMFSFVIVLALASSAVELMLAAKIPAWRRSAKKYKLINLSFSILLSFLLGMMFGAVGLIAMSAAVISTIMSIPGYSLLYWAYDSPDALAKGGNKFKYYSDKWKQVLTDFVNLMYKIFRIITFPIWATRLVFQKFTEAKNKVFRKA